MSIEKDIQTVRDFFAAMGSDDQQDLLALVAEDIEWVIPGQGWALAGTHRGHAGVAAVLRRAPQEIEMTYPTPPEFVAQNDRVLVIGVATGRIKATNTPFHDEWIFDITVRNGKLTKIKEYIDTQALARATARCRRQGMQEPRLTIAAIGALYKRSRRARMQRLKGGFRCTTNRSNPN
jgi:ketosteroid isomerase-like protein